MPHLDIAYTGAGIAVPPWNRLAPSPAPWTTIAFSPMADYPDYYDDGYNHSNDGGPSFVNGPAFVVGALVLRLEGMPVSQVQIRPYHVSNNGTGARVWTGAALDEETTDTDHNPAVTHYAVPIALRVPAGRRGRLELTQVHDSTEWPDGLIKRAQLVARVDPL